MNYSAVQLHDFVSRFDALTRVIEAATDKVKHDTIVDIQGLGLVNLEHDIDQLCADIKTAPNDVAKNTQSLMAQMISQLDDLAAMLQSLKTDLEHSSPKG